MARSRILILMGSVSDLPAFEEARALLTKFRIPFEIQVLSAHRTPRALRKKIETLPESVGVVIAAAGGAAHLAGVVAAHTLRPVIGVPMPSALKGVDSFVSTQQMPAGIPVATMSIGKAGATNAALLAAQILSLNDVSLRPKLARHRKSLGAAVRKANRKLRRSKR